MKNNQWQIALEELLLGENQESHNVVFVLELCEIKTIWTKNLFLLLVGAKKKKLLIPGISRTMNQIQKLSRAWNFFFHFQDFPGF